MFVVLQQMSRGASNQGQLLLEFEVAMTVGVENAVGEHYMMMQRKAQCIQTIEQECLINSIKHIVTLELANGATLAFICLVPNIGKIVTNSEISSLAVLLVVRQRLL